MIQSEHWIQRDISFVFLIACTYRSTKKLSNWNTKSTNDNLLETWTILLHVLFYSSYHPVVEMTVGASMHLTTSSFYIWLSFTLLRGVSMLSSYLFLSFSCTVRCTIGLASSVDLVTWPYHFYFCLFIVVSRSSWGPNAFVIMMRG